MYKESRNSLLCQILTQVCTVLSRGWLQSVLNGNGFQKLPVSMSVTVLGKGDFEINYTPYRASVNSSLTKR